MQKLTTVFSVTIVLAFYILSSGCKDKRIVTMQIKYTADRCFGSEQSELTFYNVKDSTIAVLETKGLKTKQVTLTEGQIPTLNAFLAEFERLPEKQCISTTEENYVVTYTVGQQRKTIAKKYSCNEWNGFERMKDALFKGQ